MELINRRTKEVVVNGRRQTTRMYLTVEPHRIYFTSTVGRECEMEVGLFVQFLNEDNIWQFYVDDNPDGFKLTPVKSKNAFHITNSGLINMILKSTGHKAPKQFKVERTLRFQDNNPVFLLKP